MRISENKIAFLGFVLMIALVIFGMTCSGCLGSTAQSNSESVSDAVATAEVGNTDIATTLAVTGVTVESGGLQQARTTFADVAMYLLKDKVFGFLLKTFIVFHMVVEVIIVYGFMSGNIDPRKPFKLKG